MRLLSISCIALLLFSSCGDPEVKNKSSTTPVLPAKNDSLPSDDDTLSVKNDIILAKNDIEPMDNGDHTIINTNSIQPEELVNYAATLTGIPYKYGSIDPKIGFDCSGFITYVFNHFNIAVPRSSEGFTNVWHDIPIKDAKRGDIILFTGTDSTIHVVGHMGIITSRTGRDINFIHSTSGKAYGVTTTPFNPYYQGRFVKTLRIFKQNDTD